MDKPQELVKTFDGDAYRRWQEQVELAELERVARYRRGVIEQGDPECEAVVSALEEGWAASRAR